jgi:hypothetical protein
MDKEGIKKDFKDFEEYLERCNNNNLHKIFCEWLSKGRNVAVVEMIWSWVQNNWKVEEIKEILPIVYQAIDKS